MLISIRNNYRPLTLLLFVILLYSTTIRAQQVTTPCPQIEIHSPQSLNLSTNERTLICGDPDDPAYQTIPLYQSRILLIGFLQARGYLTADVVFKSNKLIAQTNEQTTLKSIQLDDDFGLLSTLNSLYLNKVLTPQLLNSLETDVQTLLKQQGLACVQVKTQAIAQTGVVSIELENTEKMFFGNLKSEEIKGVYPKALERFYPFKKGQLYRLRQIELAEKRFLRSGIVEASYFQQSCLSSKQTKQVDLDHRFLEGPPRLIRFGIGLSSEVGPMTRARWSHQRKGSMASYRELNLQASFKNQQARVLMDEHLWKSRPRQSLLASIELQRDSQENYEELSLKLRPHLKWTRDTRQHSWQYRAGPTFIAGRYNIDGPEILGNEDYTSTSLEGSIQTMSHQYELFDVHPEEGHLLSLSFDLRHPDFGFKEPLILGHFSGLKIKPLMRLGRGQLIAALRLNLSTTWVEEHVKAQDLPPSVKHYGGGSDDLRGYRLNTLPKNEGLGALTKAGLKFELRKTHSFLPSLETVAFFDMMRFGQTPFELDPTLWLSPGLGLRWLSPIGLIQTYVAQGLAKDPKRNDGQLYFIGIGGAF